MEPPFWLSELLLGGTMFLLMRNWSKPVEGFDHLAEATVVAAVALDPQRSTHGNSSKDLFTPAIPAMLLP